MTKNRKRRGCEGGYLEGGLSYKAVLSGPGFVVVVSDNGDGSMWFF